MSLATTTRRLEALDLLRFLAALAVVVYHYVAVTDPAGATFLSRLPLHGYLGVNLFFMISGFVVLWSALGRTPREFVRARVLRLYPEFWIAVLVSAAVFAACAAWTTFRVEPLQVLVNLTMIPQYLGQRYVDGVYWTLGVELKFYALVWLLLLFRLVTRVEAALFAWLAVSTAGFLVDLGPLASLAMHPNGPLFIAGCFLFLVYDRGVTPARAGAILLCLLLSTHQALVDIEGWVPAGHATDAVRATTVVLMLSFYAAFWALVRTDWRPRHGALFAYLGSLTYPLYLLHNTGKVLFLEGTDLPRPLAFLIALAFSLALSHAVVRVAERHVKPYLARALVAVLGPPVGRARAPETAAGAPARDAAVRTNPNPSS